MNNNLIKYGTLLILLPVLQVSIFNNIDLLGYIDPYFYIIYVFIFPINKNKAALLISSFLLGLSIDFLTNDGGIHAFSTVFIAFIRLGYLKTITGKIDLDYEELNIKDISFSLLILWIFSLTITHHLLLFLLEQFSFNSFGSIMLKTFLTTTFSVILIIFGLLLFLKRKSNA